MNIISKEKKEIKWVGLPTNSAQECKHLEVSSVCRCFCYIWKWYIIRNLHKVWYIL